MGESSLKNTQPAKEERRSCVTNRSHGSESLNQHHTQRALWWHFPGGLVAFTAVVVAISNPFVRPSFAERSEQPILPFLQDGGARDSFVRGWVEGCLKTQIEAPENRAVSYERIAIFCNCYARAVAVVINTREFETLAKSKNASASLLEKMRASTTICQNTRNSFGQAGNDPTSASDDRKPPGETLAEVASTTHDAYESGRKAALEQLDAAEAQQPYWFYAGQTIGGVAACLALRVMLGWLAKRWPRSVIRIAVLNIFAFLLASWLNAHGISISRNQDFVRISALHIYFFPQLLIFFGDLCLYFVWWRRRVEPQETSARVEPNFF
jgi:hypothetical protein